MKQIQKYNYLIYIASALIWIYLQSALEYYVWGFPLYFAATDAVVTTLVLSLCIWSMVLFIKSYPTKVSIYTYAVIIALSMAGMAIFTSWQSTKWIVSYLPIPIFDVHKISLIAWLKSTLLFRFIIIWPFFSWFATTIALKKEIHNLSQRFQFNSDAATLLKEAELFKLRQQFQPHFLYNSLNSINALIQIDPEKAQNMVGELSTFLRGAVKRESEDNLNLEDELAYIHSYLAIESIRFGDRLKISMACQYPPETTIPPFLLQPILENAIKFGLYGQTGSVSIKLDISIKEHTLIIATTNPYDEYNAPPKGTGFGLQSINRRLFLLYARNDLLETQKNGTYFTTILKIPQKYV